MAATPESPSIGPLDLMRLLRVAGAALFTQASLHWQLARIEWAEEKGRLLQMVAVGLLGLAFAGCALLTIGALVIAYSWDTPYRAAAALSVVAVYALGAALAWTRLRVLSALGGRAFAATREEFAADLAVLQGRR